MIATIHLHGWDWFFTVLILLGFFLMGYGFGGKSGQGR